LNLKTLDALMRFFFFFLFLCCSGCNGLGYHLQHLEKYAISKDTYTRLKVFGLQIKHICILVILLKKIILESKVEATF
jgi:hypothetical protein